MRRVILLAVIVSLGGCATRPELYSIGSLPKNDAATGVERILLDAQETQEKYKHGFNQASWWTDLSALPIIGAAAVAGAIIFDAGKHERKRVGFIGIGTAAYTAARSMLIPAGTPELFARGHAALGCIRSEGPLFVGNDAQKARVLQAITEATLDTGLANAAYAYGEARLVAPFDDEQAKRFVASLKAVSDAMTAADEVRLNSARENNAFGTAANVFEIAVSDVTLRVATKGREGRAADYSELTKRFAASTTPVTPANDGKGAANMRAFPGKNDAQAMAAQALAANESMMGNLYRLAALVTAASRDLASRTPKYTDSLNRVKACPATI